jgi:hypothetical protein
MQETKTNENNENKDTIVVDTPRTYEKCWSFYSK